MKRRGRQGARGGSAAAARDALVVLVTAPDTRRALALARVLVRERLAACANLVGGLRSIYRWKGMVRDDAEVLLILKSRRGVFPALCARVKALHSYEVPEVIALPLHAAHRPYLAWLRAETRGK